MELESINLKEYPSLTKLLNDWYKPAINNMLHRMKELEEKVQNLSVKLKDIKSVEIILK